MTIEIGDVIIFPDHEFTISSIEVQPNLTSICYKFNGIDSDTFYLYLNLESQSEFIELECNDNLYIFYLTRYPINHSYRSEFANIFYEVGVYLNNYNNTLIDADIEVVI